MAAEKLTVAVTGVTGTIGHGLLPALEADPAVSKVVGIGTRERARIAVPARKLEYRRADIRDRAALERVLDGADVVVHLAFSLYGMRDSGEALGRLNVQGSRNVLEAATAAGARRFLYTSSAAVYGFNSARPERVDEAAPIAPEMRHFYSRHKAAVEHALRDDLERTDMTWVFFRPCAVVGPNAFGAAAHALPPRVAGALGRLASVAAAAGLRPAVPGPAVPLQFVHERDVGRAIHLALHSRKSAATYNLGGEGMVEPAEIPRLLGLRTLPVPGAATRTATELASQLPYLPPALGWIQLLTRPLEVDAGRAKRELGWEPEFTSRAALAATRRALAI